MAYSHLQFPVSSLFLVTGAAGFIGSNLCKAILRMGYRVRALDDLSTGKQDNIDLFINNPLFEFRKGDIKDFDTCLQACEGVDYVLHQAAWGSVARSIEMPLFYSMNNGQGTLNMLEAAHQKGVKKFVYASSSSVYGDDLNLPQTERRTGQVLSPYSATKRYNEDCARLYTLHHGLDTYGLRYFNVFGPRQNAIGAYAAVIPSFIRKLLVGESCYIDGDGLQSRDFTYIENVIEANLKACLSSSSAAGEVYNIACGNRVSVIDMLTTIAEILDTEPHVEFRPRRAGDINHTIADISKAKEKLGYEPEWSFRRGIAVTIEWYKAQL